MTTEAPAQSARKPDPRRARTRAALIAAARRLLAEGRVAVSVQEITTEAGVGFGSFYNHFDSKEDLFSEAVANTLDIWGGVPMDFVKRRLRLVSGRTRGV